MKAGSCEVGNKKSVPRIQLHEDCATKLSRKTVFSVGTELLLWLPFISQLGQILLSKNVSKVH